MNPPPEDLVAWLESMNGWQFVVLVAGIWWLARLIWGTAKRSIPVLRRLLAFIDALGKLPEWMTQTDGRFDALEEGIKQVRHEVLPNHGSSLRDAVEIIDRRVEAIEAKQSRDYARLNSLEKELEERVARKNAATDPLVLPPYPSDASEGPTLTADPEEEQ